MSDKLLTKADILNRLNSFIDNNEVGTIFPENFFTSIRLHLINDHKEAFDSGFEAGRVSTLNLV